MRNWYLLYDPAFIAGIVFVLGILGLLLHRTWIALNGRRRAWLLGTRRSSTMYRDTKTAWPFSLACLAVSFLLLAATLVLQLYGREAARQTVFSISFLPWVAAFGALFWWPGWLGPRWYRRWRRAPEAPFVNPWTDHEMFVVEQSRPGKARDVAVKDIERCRQLLAAPRDAAPVKGEEAP